LLEELGAEVIQFPTIEIVPPENWAELDRAIDAMGSYDWLIFTSSNGVKYFFSRLFEKGRDIRELKGLKICAIGEKTAASIGKFGIRVDLIPESFNAEGLIEALLKEVKKEKLTVNSHECLKGIRFILHSAEVAREIFPDKVRELGGTIDVPVAYRAVKPDMHGKRLRRFLKEGRITIATFTSAATFNNFREILREEADELLKGVAIAVIGPVTARAIEKAGLKVTIMPQESTVEAMTDEIIKWATKKL
jgi:uroporphyrinogen III methyltransferase/synthase